MAEIIDDYSIDLRDYLTAPKDAEHVKPASAFRQQTVDSFYGEKADPGCLLPWHKTHDLIKLRPGDLSIWAGINGHGKSVLLNQVMIGLMAQGERVCIASLEMKPRQTLRRMVKQFVGNPEPTISAIDDFYQWTDGRLWLYDQIGTVKAERMVAVIRYCIDRLKVTHFVVDSLMKCGIGVDDLNLQKAFVDELSTLVKDTNTHVHLVAHSRKRENELKAMDKFDVKGAGEITDMADNVFTILRNKSKEVEARKEKPKADILEKPDAYLNCDKQRNGEGEGIVGLYFDSESFQFAPRDNAHRFNSEDWKAGRWML